MTPPTDTKSRADTHRQDEQTETRPESKEVKTKEKRGGGKETSNNRNGNVHNTPVNNFNIYNGGKIRIDLTQTKYKILKECSTEMGWKVIAAKKDKDRDTTPNHKEDKKGTKISHKQATAEAEAAEQHKREEL